MLNYNIKIEIEKFNYSKLKFHLFAIDKHKFEKLKINKIFELYKLPWAQDLKFSKCYHIKNCKDCLDEFPLKLYYYDISNNKFKRTCLKQCINLLEDNLEYYIKIEPEKNLDNYISWFIDNIFIPAREELTKRVNYAESFPEVNQLLTSSDISEKGILNWKVEIKKPIGLSRPKLTIDIWMEDKDKFKKLNINEKYLYLTKLPWARNLKYSKCRDNYPEKCEECQNEFPIKFYQFDEGNEKKCFSHIIDIFKDTLEYYIEFSPENDYSNYINWLRDNVLIPINRELTEIVNYAESLYEINETVTS